MEDRVHSIASVLLRIPVSRTTLYGLIGSGDLASVKVGGRRFVKESALQAYLAQLQCDVPDQPARTASG